MSSLRTPTGLYIDQNTVVQGRRVLYIGALLLPYLVYRTLPLQLPENRSKWTEAVELLAAWCIVHPTCQLVYSF